MARATRLGRAIRDCDPEDALQILPAALYDLSAGMPSHAALLSIENEATWWANWASPLELNAAIEAALKVMGSRALHLKTRKQLFVALWNTFSPEDRRAFLIRVDKERLFGGRNG